MAHYIEAIGVIRQGQLRHFEWTVFNPLSIEEKEYRRSPPFDIYDHSFFMRVRRKSSSSEEFCTLDFGMENCEQPISIRCYFTLKKKDGRYSSNALTFNFDKKNLVYGFRVLKQDYKEKLPTASWELTCSVISPELEGLLPRPVFEKFDTLSMNLKEMFENEVNCDITIQVDDKEFQAHRFILAARSPIMGPTFQHDMVENETGVITVKDCCPKAFKLFLEYLYSGKVEHCTWSNVFHLYRIAHKYNATEMIIFCKYFLIENLSHENIVDVIKLADHHMDTELMTPVEIYFVQNYRNIITTNKWLELLTDRPNLAFKIMLNLA